METVFSTVDYVVFSLMLVASAAVGIYFYFTGGKQKTTNEILLGDKNMSIAPVAFSLMASFSSAVGMLALPTENYLFGFQLSILGLGNIIGTVLVVYVYHPVFYNMKITSVYEYLNRRFGNITRYAGSLVFMIHMILYMAVVLYAPALALNAVTGISKWIAVISVGVVCTFYCTLGGIKAVLWTDLFQALIMYATMFTLIIKGCIDVGGLSNVWKISSEGGRTKFDLLEFDLTKRYSFWGNIIAGTFFYVAINAVNQTQVQRMMTVNSLKKSRNAIFVSLPLSFIFHTLICFCGLVIYANLGFCDPVLNKKQSGITSPDQLFPYFIMVSLGHFPGLPGLCVAGLFSASISTLSSAINSLAAVTLEDYIRPNCRARSLTESRAALITKLLAIFYGFLSIILAYLVDQFGGLMQATLTIFGVLGGPMLGLFTLGMLFRRPNQKGAVSGLLLSIGICMWISFGSRYHGVKAQTLPLSTEGCISQENITSTSNYSIDNYNNLTSLIETTTLVNNINDERYVFPLYKLSYMLYSVVGAVLTVIFGYFISLITGPLEHVESELISPVAIWARNKEQKETYTEINIYHETFQENQSNRLHDERTPK